MSIAEIDLFDELEKSADGKVGIYPLVAFETFVPHGRLCGLKVHYLESPQELLDGQSSSVPLVMTPSMARRIAHALTEVANEAENGATGEVAQ